MQLEQYKSVWESLKPTILEKMTALSAGLKTVVQYAVSDVYASGPDESMLSDEYRISFDLKNEKDVVVMSVEFALMDATDAGEDGGCAVMCSFNGLSGLVLGGYAPARYTEDCYTEDIDILSDRVDEFDIEEAAQFIVNEALHDETLLEEVREASK